MNTQDTSPQNTVENYNQPTFLPLLPLKSVVILPNSIIPIIVGRKSSIQAVEFALKADRTLFVTAQKEQETENPSINDVFTYGTRATILQVMRMPKGALKILVEGISRSHVLATEETDGFIGAYCVDVPALIEEGVELEALWRHMHSIYKAFTQLNPKIPNDLLLNVKTAADMDCLADTLLVHVNLAFAERQTFLETPNLKERLLKLCAILQKEIDILETEERIKGRVQTQVEKNQREYYLAEQMKAIQKELGRDDNHAEIAQLRSTIKTLKLPTEVAEKAEKELRRLEQMPGMSAEATVSRHYIDWIIALPWHKVTKDSISLEKAEELLNARHAGLSKPKERILEFLAAKKFSASLERSPILCLVGPPGVGKTSLGLSVAESLGREFVRISLGGVRDEAEIRGHRRTYIGALPGKILQAMRKAKTLNPVILLDEIDKMAHDVHGDPGSALLEVLDPEQNKTFVDHFLELEYDLSKVMFLTTANTLDGIPYPLFDRMEIIQLSGYSDDEKLAIVKGFLIPKNLKEYGLKKRQFKISDDLIRKVITEYTKEAGVRNIDRVIAKLMRKVIQVLLKNTEQNSVSVTEATILKWLGFPKYKKPTPDHVKERIGLATGLAWTELGGDVLEIEATVVSGKGNMTLTGQLGEVMQESAHAALTYIKSRASELGLSANFNANKDIHIHVPEGATPKDGPSAGITMCLALVSALTKNPINPLIAMTGEITLRGRVLPIGGLKEKLLAAKQHGATTVIVPLENKNDYEEIKHEVDTTVNYIFVDDMDDVLKNALLKPVFRKKMKRVVKKEKK